MSSAVISADPLDTTIAVVTPENIAFQYEIAGPFRRLPAYLIDLFSRWAIMLAVIIAIWLLGALVSLQGLSAYMLAASFLAYFIFTNFYGTLLETFFNGKTIGKWACGIRVVSTDGSPIDGRAAFIRNLIRVADLAPYAVLNEVIDGTPPIFILPTGMVGLFTMMMTRRLQRLGDLAAGTMVIIDQRNWRLPVTKVEDPRIPALASYLPGTYVISRSMARTLAVYVERRHFLTPARRREIARKLTVPLVDQFEFRPDIDPDLLMVALYYKNFLWNSSAEPVDLGPLAGFSPLAKDAAKTGSRKSGVDEQAGMTEQPLEAAQ